MITNCNNCATISSFESVDYLEKDNHLSEFVKESDKRIVRQNLGLTIGDSAEEEKINPDLMEDYFNKNEVINTAIINNNNVNEWINERIESKINTLVGELGEGETSLSAKIESSYTNSQQIPNIQENIIGFASRINTNEEFIEKIKNDYYQEEDGQLKPLAPTTAIPEKDSIDEEDLYHIFITTGESSTPFTGEEISFGDIDIIMEE